MTNIDSATSTLPSDLPIPATELHYADPAANAQSLTFTAFVDHIHYPTLGCPAFLKPEAPLQLLLSLPAGMDPGGATVELSSRHTPAVGVHRLSILNAAESLGRGPDGARALWRVWVATDNVPAALFDVKVTCGGCEEVQYNAVRIYESITGTEPVILCGDPQYNVKNKICLERFIAQVNELDVAWIAMAGDVVDCGVKSKRNIVLLAIKAGHHTVVHYYEREYREAHELLRQLRHPVRLIPGNHDGICAYKNYARGTATDVFVGPDPANEVAYDGLHHFRRTFGPLYHRFDWAGTRYICLNTFELDRHQRLGFHAIVSNWGGWMREEQIAWMESELKDASRQNMNKVIVAHHDLRGGCEGKQLGQYHKFRSYKLNNPLRIMRSYLAYVFGDGRGRWQQEWMTHAKSDLAQHPARRILTALLEHKVFAVIMGHDNVNWIDSYYQGDDLFATDPATIKYATRADVQDDALVEELIDALDTEDGARLAELLERGDEDHLEAALTVALDELGRAEEHAERTYSASAKEWGLDVGAAIHFVHVDDLGAYKHSEEKHFSRYGFVLASLVQGLPVEVQSVHTSGGQGRVTQLLTE